MFFSISLKFGFGLERSGGLSTPLSPLLSPAALPPPPLPPPTKCDALDQEPPDAMPGLSGGIDGDCAHPIDGMEAEWPMEVAAMELDFCHF